MSSTTRQNESPAHHVTRVAHARCLMLCVIVLFCCVVGTAQTPAPPAPLPTPGLPAGTPNANPCDKPPGEKKSLADTAKCLKHYYDIVTSKDGLHLVHGGVAPGSGFAGGFGYSYRGHSGDWQSQFDASARVSTRKYWEVDSNLRLTKSSSKFSCSEWGPQSALKMDFYGQIRDMPRLDYFGTGPESREQDRAVFHYREGVVGADASRPTGLCWLDVGGAVEGIFPDITPIANPSVRSVERAYTEASAPGLTAQPAFLHFAAYARLHSRNQPEARKMEYLFIYHAYQDLQKHLYSFRRFDADLRNKFPIGDKNEIRVRGRLSLSESRAGQRVPFYLMETLGGSNIRGDDTLRGFRDYRFRDRDYALLQTDYLRSLYGPIDFVAFYDVGKVASSIGNFGDGRLRHTYGLGVVVVPRQLDNVLFRFYVALGSGEGSHTYFGGGNNGRADRLVR